MLIYLSFFVNKHHVKPKSILFQNMIVGHIHNVFNNFQQSCTSSNIAVKIADYQTDCT